MWFRILEKILLLSPPCDVVTGYSPRSMCSLKLNNFLTTTSHNDVNIMLMLHIKKKIKIVRNFFKVLNKFLSSCFHLQCAK